MDEWSKMKNANGKNILEEFYSDPARNAYLFQSIAFRSRMKNIVHKDDALIERSIYTDRNVFAKTCREDGLIGDIEWDDYVVVRLAHDRVSGSAKRFRVPEVRTGGVSRTHQKEEPFRGREHLPRVPEEAALEAR